MPVGQAQFVIGHPSIQVAHHVGIGVGDLAELTAQGIPYRDIVPTQQGIILQ